MTNFEKLFRDSAHLHLDFTINRYLMSNTKNRLDGSEKAIRHRELCEFYVKIAGGTPLADYVDTRGLYSKIHDITADKLTNHLSEKIGFPIDDFRPDYNKLSKKFFNEFHDIAMEIIQKGDNYD